MTNEPVEAATDAASPWRWSRNFCPLSLGDWIEACEQAGVPFIPAEVVAVVERDDFLKYDVDGPHQARLRTAFDAIDEAGEDRHMMRWDHVSMLGLKARLGRGKPEWHEEFLYISPGDPRAFEFATEHPRVTLPVWKRPWITAQIVDSYPVEYRAFVDRGKLLGVSSYYLQRPLPDNALRHDEVGTVRSYTERLMATLGERTPFEWQRRYQFGASPMERRPPDPGVAFSADFLVTEGGEVLFIEGGPPASRGAHSCCFDPERIEGLALVNGNPHEDY